MQCRLNNLFATVMKGIIKYELLKIVFTVFFLGKVNFLSLQAECTGQNSVTHSLQKYLIRDSVTDHFSYVTQQSHAMFLIPLPTGRGAYVP